MNMVNIKISFLFILIIYCVEVGAQNQTILVFDPTNTSINFQESFSTLSEDNMFVTDTLYEGIRVYSALFIFLGEIYNAYTLSQAEGNMLIEYLNLGKPIYLYTDVSSQYINFVSFWNYIGVNGVGYYFPVFTIDSVIGVDTTFTENVEIDTNFISYNLPIVYYNVTAILIGVGGFPLQTTYISSYDSLNVIIDLYNLIHHPEFLERVLIHFGLEEPNSIIDDNTDQPNAFYLYQNYPNPFNPTTKIKFTIPSVETGYNPSPQTTLKVYDVLGNEIATLVNEEKLAGSYEVEFEATGLPSGIYFYQLRAGKYIETKKMVLIR